MDFKTQVVHNSLPRMPIEILCMLRVVYRVSNAVMPFSNDFVKLLEELTACGTIG